MKQNNQSYDSINDRQLQSPNQPSHKEYLQSRKDFIMMHITSQQYKDQQFRPTNQTPQKLQQLNSAEQLSYSEITPDQGHLEQIENKSNKIHFRKLDEKKLGNYILQYRNEANQMYSVLNFKNLLRQIGLTQEGNQAEQQNKIIEQLWRVFQFSCNSPYADTQIIKSVLIIILNRNLTLEQQYQIIFKEFTNNFKLCTQQNSSEDFSKQLEHSKINLKDIIHSFYEYLLQNELNECILVQDYQSPLKTQNKSNIYNKNKEDRHEKLFQHAQLLNQKRNTFSLLKQKEELDQCTFQPLVNRNQINMTSPKYQKILSQEVHHRLYENAQDIKRSQEEHQILKQRQIQEEIDQFPYHPKINKIDATELHAIEKKNVAEYVPGAKTIVERMEKARKIKAEKDEFWDKQMQQYREKEVKTSPTKTQEFSFMNRNPLKKEPIMYLDVNISTSKKGRIALYKGDDYKKVAKDFAKIYRLNQEAIKELEDRVQQAIQIYYSSFV